MPIFSYKAKSAKGRPVSGSVEATSSAQAVEVLHRKGWIPITISEAKPVFSAFGGGRVRVSSKDKVVFTRQLATMLEAGLPLTQALDVLSKQVGSVGLRKILTEALSGVRGGSPLSDGFAQYPEVFSKIYVSLVRAGEASGSLDKVLLRLADTLEKSEEFKAKVKGAMVYPAIVVTAMLAVFTIIMIFVMPKLTDMYADLGTDLPASTRVMIGISDFAVSKWWLVLLLIIAAVVAIRITSKTKQGSYFLARLSLRLPIFGKLTKNVELTEFTRTLSLLGFSGMPILDSLEIVAAGINNLLYRDAVREAARQVTHGARLSAPLSADDSFPPILSQMVAVGEETGMLPDVLEKVSVFFERESEHTVKNLTTALEPFIMVVLGIGVAILVLSIVLPIYNLTAQF